MALRAFRGIYKCHSPQEPHTPHPFMMQSRAEGQGQSRGARPAPRQARRPHGSLLATPRAQQTQAWPPEPGHPPLTLLEAPQPLAPPRMAPAPHLKPSLPGSP